VAQHPFPGPGHDGDEPLPDEAERAWVAEQDRYVAWLTAEIDAGRIEVPPEEEEVPPEEEPPPAQPPPDYPPHGICCQGHNVVDGSSSTYPNVVDGSSSTQERGQRLIDYVRRRPSVVSLRPVLAISCRELICRRQRRLLSWLESGICDKMSR
jgi:hypothetical protein